MHFDEYRDLDATALASLVARGEVRAAELLDLAMDRAAEVEPWLNAITVDDQKAARRLLDAGVPAGCFAGVPLLLKDLYAFKKGTALTNGSALIQGLVAPHDSTLVSRLEATGVVIFGKTSSPELGLNVTTEPRLHGPTRNPWNPAHSVGGSSGGSAAAVAAGIVPMAHATDGGGSIRIPASCCGLVGLKPSRARNPTGPELGEAWNGLACGHVVSRTLRDTARMLDALHGPEAGDIYACPPPSAPFAQALDREPPPMRIALITRTLRGEAIHPDCVAAVEAAGRMLQSLGHEVEEAMPEIDGERLADAMLDIVFTNVANDLALWSRAMRREIGEDTLERCTLAMGERGRQVDGMRFLRALQTIQRAARAMGRFHQRHDLLLMPTLGLPPPELGWLDQNMDDLDTYLERQAETIPFTPLANMTGAPAISLPLHWNAHGLPVGVMLQAPLGTEERLLSLAARLEEAVPWRDRRPPN